MHQSPRLGNGRKEEEEEEAPLAGLSKSHLLLSLLSLSLSLTTAVRQTEDDSEGTRTDEVQDRRGDERCRRNEDRDERSTTKVDDVRIDRIEDGRRTTRRHVRKEGHRTRDDVDDHSTRREDEQGLTNVRNE